MRKTSTLFRHLHLLSAPLFLLSALRSPLSASCFNKQQKPYTLIVQGFVFKKEMRQRPTLPLVAVPLVLRSLTAVFGMGTGGTSSPGHLININKKDGFCEIMESVVVVRSVGNDGPGGGIVPALSRKTHGRLVLPG